MQKKRISRGRRVVLFGTAAAAGIMATASVASACVAFVGQMTVDGHDGDTIVTGTGNSHGYCSTGRPATAAAGHLNDTLTLAVTPGVCADAGAVLTHKLPAAIYEVRYRNFESYTFAGTSWTMKPGHGCFRDVNATTTSTIGTFSVDANGFGSWTGTINPIAGGATVYSAPGGANNLCVGTQDPAIRMGYPTNDSRPGMLAPYQMLI